MILTDEIKNLLISCTAALNCPRGEFYTDKNYGSLISNKSDDCISNLLAYARQALSDFDGVYVKSAEAGESEIIFTLLINNEERQVSITP